MRRLVRCMLVVVLSASPAMARKQAPQPPPVPSYAQMDEAARGRWLAEARVIVPLPTRLKQASAPFVGTPYGISPLGEGSGPDADPRLRYDLVDCLTFVETAMALALAPNDAGVLPVLDDIRYGARASFEERNHFVEAQWVPNNLRKGWIRDITADVAGRDLRTVAKAYGPERWRRRRQVTELDLDAEFLPSGSFSLPIVPLAAVAARPERLPSGTLLFVVRSDFASHPTRVSHVGIVFDTPGGKVLRHASKAPYHRVVDEPLAHFFGRNAGYERWPVEGFAAYEVQAPAERVERLLRPPDVPPFIPVPPP